MPQFTASESFLAELTEALRIAIETKVVPTIRGETRIDSGALRDSTKVETIAIGSVQIAQGGTEECDYAVWVELRFQDFSRALSSIDWENG